MKVKCSECSTMFEMPNHKANRYIKLGYKFHCSKDCPAKVVKTKEQLKEEKRIYDKAYRVKHLNHIHATQKKYRERTKDQRNQYLARQRYGELCEAVPVLKKLNIAIKKQVGENGTEKSK